ncbi:MAG TPA: site-specific integrase [Ferruginibacter sp.]|nr:site-specific integrase [Ferruginibacter sp.]
MLTTGEKIIPAHWNFKEQRAIVNKKPLEYSDLNFWLNKIETTAKTFFRDCNIKGVIPTAVEAKAHLEEKLNINYIPKASEAKKITSILAFADKLIEERKNQVAKGTITNYRTIKKHLSDYCKLQGKTDLSFNEIDIEFYNSFVNYLNTLNFAKNTIAKAIKDIKTFMNASLERQLHNNLQFKSKAFKKTTENIDNVYLTEEEISRINNLQLGGSVEISRDLFVIGCYTGLRFSDFTTLRKEHIQNNFIVKSTQKTKSRVTIPIHPIVKKILEKYSYQLPKAPANQKVNMHLKEIAKKAEIDQDIEVVKTYGGKEKREVFKKHDLVSTHSARRSFATNSYLAGVPTIAIMMITSHTTESSFMKYICVNQLESAVHIQSHAFFNASTFDHAA